MSKLNNIVFIAAAAIAVTTVMTAALKRKAMPVTVRKLDRQEHHKAVMNVANMSSDNNYSEAMSIMGSNVDFSQTVPLYKVVK